MSKYKIFLDKFSNEYYVEIKDSQPTFPYDEYKLPDNTYREDLIKKMDVLPFTDDDEKNDLLSRLRCFDENKFKYCKLQNLVKKYNETLESKSNYYQ